MNPLLGDHRLFCTLFAPYLRPASKFWEAFYWLKSWAYGANRAQTVYGKYPRWHYDNRIFKNSIIKSFLKWKLAIRSRQGVDFSIVKLSGFALHKTFALQIRAKKLDVGERRKWIELSLWLSLSENRTRNWPQETLCLCQFISKLIFRSILKCFERCSPSGRDSGNDFGRFSVLGYPTKIQLCFWSFLSETTWNKASFKI